MKAKLRRWQLQRTFYVHILIWSTSLRQLNVLLHRQRDQHNKICYINWKLKVETSSMFFTISSWHQENITYLGALKVHIVSCWHWIVFCGTNLLWTPEAIIDWFSLLNFIVQKNLRKTGARQWSPGDWKTSAYAPISQPFSRLREDGRNVSDQSSAHRYPIIYFHCKLNKKLRVKKGIGYDVVLITLLTHSVFSYTWQGYSAILPYSFRVVRLVCRPY